MPWWGLDGMTGDHADNCGYSGLKRDLIDFNPVEVYTGLLAKLEHSFIFTPHHNCNAIGFHNHQLN